jgi:hypothetical protein
MADGYISLQLIAKMTLILGETAFSVANLLLSQTCDLFENDPPTSPYRVQSCVSPHFFESFLEAVNGKDIQITNENVSDLLQLCNEFGFRSLSSKLSAFGDSPKHELSVLEECVSQEDQAIIQQNQIIAEHEQTIEEQEQANAQLSASSKAAQELFPEETVNLSSDILRLKVLALPLLDSQIVSDFPSIFDEFCRKHFVLLWRGSRDGFGARDFHQRCDGHANTLTLILDTDGNVFGGFTPLAWESRISNSHTEDNDVRYKCDESLQSFVYTLENIHDIPARKFSLKDERKRYAICCDARYGPIFPGGFLVDNYSDNRYSNFTSDFGKTYLNDTGLDGETFFTGSYNLR